MLDVIKAKTTRLENWGDQWAAHRNYDVVLGKKPMPATSLKEISEVLARLAAFMNEFERIYQDPTREFVFDDTISQGEYSKSVLEWERLKIDSPTDYQNFPFTDDGETILKLIANM